MVSIAVFAAALAIQEAAPQGAAPIVHEGKPLSVWIAELTHKKYDVQKRAEKAVVAIGPAAVPALMATLSDPRPPVRAAAAEALGKLKDARAVPPLIQLLKDREQPVRNAAALALGALGDKSAVGPLLATLEPPGSAKDFNSHTSVRALGQIGGDEAGAALVRLSGSDPRSAVRFLSVDTLADLLGEKAVEPLGAALRDSDSRVRDSAARALARFEGPRVVELLEAAAKDPQTGQAAAQALRDVDTRGKPTKSAGDFQVTLMGLELSSSYGSSFSRLSARGENEIVIVRYRLKALAPIERAIEQVELYDAGGQRLPPAAAAAGMFSISIHQGRKAGQAVTTESTFAAKKGTKFGTAKIQGAEFELAEVVPTRRAPEK